MEISCNYNNLMNKLNFMDCVIGMKHFPDKYFDLAIADPPYGLGSTNFATARMKKREDKKWNKNIPGPEYFEELYRVSKNQIIWGENYFGQYIKHPGRIVFNKLMTSRNGPLKLSDCDLASCSIGKRIMYFEYQWSGNVQNGKMNCRNIENLDKGIEKRIHPTQKPVALYRWILKNYCEKGDKILDTHVGSGSSIIAFIDEGFDYCGFEIDIDYYNLASVRIGEFKEQGKFFL